MKEQQEEKHVKRRSSMRLWSARFRESRILFFFYVVTKQPFGRILAQESFHISGSSGFSTLHSCFIMTRTSLLQPEVQNLSYLFWVSTLLHTQEWLITNLGNSVRLAGNYLSPELQRLTLRTLFAVHSSRMCRVYLNQKGWFMKTPG